MDYTTYGYGYGDAAGMDMATAFKMSTPMMIFYLAIAVFSIVCMWKIFKKAGYNGWEAIIPIYNIVVLFKIVGLSPWLVLLILFPPALYVAMIIADVKLAKCFGKGAGFAVGLIFLGPIFYAILAFDSSTYTALS